MDSREFRDAMGKFATGITVVATEEEGEVKGMTVNAFMSVSLEPQLIAISIDEKASMYQVLQDAGKFGISILTEEQKDLSMIFARQIEKDRDIPFEWLNGNPVIKGSLAMLSCNVKETAEAGDHMIFIAEVQELRINEGEPVLFYGGKYQEIK